MPGRTKTQTLTANTVATVTLDKHYKYVEVVNRDATAEVFFRVDGVDPAAPGNDGDEFVANVIGGSCLIPSPKAGDTVVKLKSTGATKVFVRGLNRVPGGY